MADATRVKVERCAKRLRVYIGGEIIADSIHAKLVWELTHYPTYYFPAADVRMAYLSERSHRALDIARPSALLRRAGPKPCSGERRVVLSRITHS